MPNLLMPKLKSVFLTLVFTLALAATISATTATLEEMTRVCDNWLTYMVLHKGAWAGSTTPAISSVQEIKINDTLVARYFAINPSGFMIVPALKEMPPILACSEESQMNLDDPDGAPAMLKEVLTDRSRRFASIYGSMEASQPDTGDVFMDRAQRQTWNIFQKDESQFKGEMTAKKLVPMAELGPLLTSSWHQSDPYNLFCPPGDGGKCVVGCVATAAAQIMVYHKWPLAATGTRSYWWGGDGSCGGSTSGQMLNGDFNHSYDWANMRDNCGGGCTSAERNAVALLSSDVGLAFAMDYGRCGSGAYTSDVVWVFPEYFRYYNHILELNRSGTSLRAWSDSIRIEIENNRPIQYKISRHSIVLDGWRQLDLLYQVHMNYGWGGSQTLWYTIDQLYCTWDGCSQWIEQMYTHIEPDRGVFFTADTTWGMQPLPINFTGTSSMPSVDSWRWDFGDGDSAFVQSPSHTYTHPGRFDVKLQAISGSEVRNYQVQRFVTVLADTLSAVKAKGDPGGPVELTINARNTVPIRHFQIPISFAGMMALQYDSFSTAGCRTSYFDHAAQITFDPENCLTTFSIYNSEIGSLDLEPGSGPILKIYFTIPGYAQPEEGWDINVTGYGSSYPMFYGPVVDYPPIPVNGRIKVAYLCGDANSDEIVNILDLTYLINYLYKSGPSPVPVGRGDTRGDGTLNVLDVTYLIGYLYRQGSAPLCPD